MTLQTKYEKKSKKSRKRNRFNLTFPENRNFFTFYMDNRKAVDLIINASAAYFHAVVPIEDMHNEILWLLHKNDFLEGYDSSKSSLHTYLTNTVRGYVRHVVDRERSKKGLVREKISCDTCPYKDECNDSIKARCENRGTVRWKNRLGTQVLTEGLNNSLNDKTLYDLKNDSNVESYINAKENLKLIKKKLQETDKNLASILNLYANNYKRKEIAKIHKVRPNVISSKYAIIKEISGSVLGIKKEIKNGNGHKIGKKRKLTHLEKQKIKEAFIKVGGIIEEDFCKKIHQNMNNVSIFQVTGYVTSLHSKVSRKKISIPDFNTYAQWMRKRRKKWASYKSDRYKAYAKRLYSRFTHTVGKTTFKHGFTIPKKILKYISLPEKNQSKKVLLSLNNKKIPAHINKAGQSIQIRYGKKQGTILKNYLNNKKTFDISITDNIFEIKTVYQDPGKGREINQ